MTRLTALIARVPGSIKWIIIEFLIWIVAVPWFFIPWGDAKLGGVPIWIVYVLFVFLLHAIIVATASLLFWDKLSGANAKER